MDPGLKIITFEESKSCDSLTMKMEGMHPHDLMDRATLRIFQRLKTLIHCDTPITVLCGPGDNGADGLCLSSMLAVKGYHVETKICLLGKNPAPSIAFRLALYGSQKSINIQVVQKAEELTIQQKHLVIDALFGTGLTRPLRDEWQKIIESINGSGAEIISIDLPSGLLDEPINETMSFIKASKVITIQSPKPALLYPENRIDFEVIECGIHTESIHCRRFFLDNGISVREQMKTLLPKRPRHSHKGTFGHTLLIGGNTGMHGAISMAAKTCYDSGSGLTTVLSPETTVPYLASLPAVMHIPCSLAKTSLSKINPEKYQSVAIGPGLGNTAETTDLLKAILNMFRIPVIVDADALNIIAANPELLYLLPKGSLLTPHPTEFNRLFGSTQNGKEKELLAIQKSQEFDMFILAKNTYSFLACPDGKIFYNGTGDSGLARGGSGDRLTGMIAGLFAQNQNMRDSALAGMYFSGLNQPVI
ncbi:MAG: NAD(P)H-hydrate dehydratase [Bacteroidetes bacterium]|nr:NAD(P)H-hydrate dehydratase [Bacteroidota bacterium]